MTAELKEYLSSLELRYGKAKKEEERTKLAFEIMGIKIAVKHMTEYASQQRTEGIKEGFEAARRAMDEICYYYLYPTVNDYLNQK